MNLVMQFRKVCNHPELFERRASKSPLVFQENPTEITHPKSVSGYREVFYCDKSPLFFRVPALLRDFRDFSQKESKLLVVKHFLLTPYFHDFEHFSFKLQQNPLKYLAILHYYHKKINFPPFYLDKDNIFPSQIRSKIQVYMPTVMSSSLKSESQYINPVIQKELIKLTPSYLDIPDYLSLIADSAKLKFLDSLLTKLKARGNRVLIFCQMTRMMDILEDYFGRKRYTYFRLDGSSNITNRRDMVNEFQENSKIFVFLLSTRAGGLGVTLTAADTVIFYDNDWNPTMDAQATDRAHRIGQTKDVTVYRLVTKNTIEERILIRAQQKQNVQATVYSGGAFKADSFKINEMKDLLFGDQDEDKTMINKEGNLELDFSEIMNKDQININFQ